MGTIHDEPFTACGDETECFGGNREGSQSFHSSSTKEENLEDSYLYLVHQRRASSPGTREPTPEWLVRLMRVKYGENPINVINKELTATNVKPHHRRLSMPFSQIIDFEFLNPDEKRIIEEHANKEREEGVDVILVNFDRREYMLNLRRWNMGTSPLYILVSGRYNVVKGCRLKEGNEIRIWSFHFDDQLYLAMVPLTPTESG
ncbi:unnamed protein product [Arabidopsis thaliana]|uniref:B3 domain-containing protein n=1 Tax=Arabidopsis thaliana TaxID=3702 RepID=A0A5S9SSE4_ARATH|nr:unnamed protein product [Arabidopsis thaliana]